MLRTPVRPVVATHWGTYHARLENGRAVALDPIADDADPSPIANSMIGALDDPARIGTPMVRATFLEKGPAAGGIGRGSDAFVPVEWPEAIALVARELDRVRKQHGNSAIYGGSYGWASAGRFHHAQSQVHRFLNAIGGYTRSVQNYSFAAGATILPHIIGSTDGLGLGHTTWPSIVENTQTVVMFGGVPARNSQVNAGGVHKHILGLNLDALCDRGAALISISPIRDDVTPPGRAEWLPICPGTDVALMLGIAHVLVSEDLHDRDFLERYTVGFDRFHAYLTGQSDAVTKTPEWAAAITRVPADRIRELARRMAASRTMVMMAWSLQRADHGEQPYWMAITLAAMLGQIGLPGGGFGFGYGSVNGIGNPLLDLGWPSLDQRRNPVQDFIPVARLSDMLLSPGTPYDFNGERRTYPEIRLVYWAGGNPFHHHQDMNRLLTGWRKPEVVISHDSWWNALTRHSDIVLPVKTQLERNDIVCAARERMLTASHKVADPFGQARSDYDIFTHISQVRR